MPNGLKQRMLASPIWQATQMLPPRPRRKLILLVLVQVFLGLVDLVAVGLVGVLGTLAVAGVQSRTLGSSGTVGRVLNFLHLSGLEVQLQIAWLAGATTLVFISRTVASIYLTRRALHFLGLRSAEASSDLIDQLLEQPLTFLQSRSMQDFIYAVTASANALVLGVLGTIVVMAADTSMLIAMAVLLLLVSPIVALVAGALLGVLVVLLHKLTTGKAHSLGTLGARYDIESRDLLVEAMSTYRDMQVRGSRGYYAAKLRDARVSAAYVAAEWAFLPNVSKYVLEAAVIIGAFVVGGLEFWLENAERAVGVISLFLAAGMRLAPAVIRIQQGSIALRGSLGQAQSALRLQHEFLPLPAIEHRLQPIFAATHQGFVPRIECREVSFTYPGSTKPAIDGLELTIEPGEFLALVGPSGGGKSTTADLILGVLKPDQGSIKIDGVPPREAEENWPGGIAYVPQDVWIVEGSVRRNVTLGFPETSVPDDIVWEALALANLDAMVMQLPSGLDCVVGERGTSLSGGQRQRLGIARALLTRPKLLVLDEATSALDADTEHSVATALIQMNSQTTRIVVAHRLAAIRNADRLAYIEGGRLRAAGTFDEVRRAMPDFARQAQILGL